MTESNDPARNRFIVMQVTRTMGVVMVLASMLMLTERLAVGDARTTMLVGYTLLAVGLFDIFVVPALLARKWRSPK